MTKLKTICMVLFVSIFTFITPAIAQEAGYNPCTAAGLTTVSATMTGGGNTARRTSWLPLRGSNSSWSNGRTTFRCGGPIQDQSQPVQVVQHPGPTLSAIQAQQTVDMTRMTAIRAQALQEGYLAAVRDRDAAEQREGKVKADLTSARQISDRKTETIETQSELLQVVEADLQAAEAKAKKAEEHARLLLELKQLDQQLKEGE